MIWDFHFIKGDEGLGSEGEEMCGTGNREERRVEKLVRIHSKREIKNK